MDSNKKIFRLDTSKITNPVLRFGAGLSRPFIERSLCFPQLNRIYDSAVCNENGDSFPRRVLSAMDVTWTVNAVDDSAVPATGPVVFVANHPFGGIEGVLLLALLEKYRLDTKVMANYILSTMPELRDSFFFVDPFGGPVAQKANLHSMKACLKWLQDGHGLGVFPAGEVSSVDMHTGKVRDPAWSPSIARFVRRTKASVVPVFFTGHNGALFNMAGLIHPRLRTVMLPQQFVNKRRHEIHAEIGQAIQWREMEEYATDEQLIQFMRLRTYILGERATAKPPKHSLLGFSHQQKKPKSPNQVPIIDALPSAELQAEIDALPVDALLHESGDMQVFCTKAVAAPKILREIGRLRETTYRAVGEGTNHEIDLDSYDEYYEHLFIWNKAKHEIVGAYRMGLADEIMPRLGVKGLYTNTCFKYDERLVAHLQPAIELGRSFVRVEYQRAFLSLLLLWKGICVFITRHPHYTTLFGPVSISADYLDVSRNLMLRSLRFSNFENDLAKLVRPRVPPRRVKKAEWNLPDFNPYIDNIELVSKMIQDIESDQKGIPVLLRQYLKMGGKILAFNVDPEFNYCIDGLIAVNMLKCDPRVLKRYMGASEHAAYIAYHGLTEEQCAEAAHQNGGEE